MGTSEQGGAIAFDPADLGADRFADATLVRWLISSAKHKADEAGQVVLNWSAPVAALWQVDSDPHIEIYGPGVGGALHVATDEQNGERWFYFGLRGLYSPHVRAAGDAYRLRVRLAGCSSAGDRVDFGFVVAPATLGSLLAHYGSVGGWPSKLYSEITSTTPAVLTPDDGSSIITIPRDVVDRSLVTRTSVIDLGGAPVDVVFPLLQVIPVGQTFHADSVPQLHQAYAAEFVGAT